MPGPTDPRTMLYSAEAPEGRIFNTAEAAAAALEAGWSDTPVPAPTEAGEWSETPQDALALALEAFVTIEKPLKDDWLALATAAQAPTEFFGMTADDLRTHLGGALETTRQPLADTDLPWSYGQWADAIRKALIERALQ